MATGPEQLLAADPAVRELERVIDDLRDVYERLAAIAESHHDAIRRADVDALSRCVAAEGELARRIAEIEKSRLRVVGGLAQRLGSRKRAQTPISWILERVAGEAGERLRDAAASLRAVMPRAANTHAAAREAAELLAKHTAGVLRAVAAEAGGPPTYGQRGAIDAPRISTLDLST